MMPLNPAGSSPLRKTARYESLRLAAKLVDHLWALGARWASGLRMVARFKAALELHRALEIRPNLSYENVQAS